ncbi:metallophosphoesterase family protein [Companilactobacillus jidongensis]|uniref:metallophosphoesterase family protein n=1 Tax=Companilactobacillus jidongensis TaxID=2486006 RepID=UPI000F7AF379|nr:metallophosphoesterase [Companilactobacillus jidongensis]
MKTNELKIVQITDTHLTPRDAKPANHQRVDPYIKLQNIFQDVELMPDRPDMAVISGDLVHEGVEFDYQKLKDIIDYQSQRLHIPIYVILGNHDRTEAFYRGYLEEEPQEKYYYGIATGLCDIYFIDSTYGDIEQGYINNEQLDWLKRSLQNSDKKMSLIFMHHPVDGPAVIHMRYSILQNSEELLDIVQGSSVKAIFSGHIHFPTEFNRENILCSTADSSAYHINCDNHHNHLVMDATSYNIITVADDKVGVETRSLLVHDEIINQVPIDDTDFVDRNMFV